MIRGSTVFLLAVLSTYVGAQALELPRNAVLFADERSDPDLHAIPLGPIAQGQFPLTTERGAVTRRTWHIGQTDLTSLQIFETLRDQLSTSFGEALFACRSFECGGFDFRFAIEVLDAPAMFVDLGDFHFASFRSEDTAQYATLLVSKGGGTGYVQLIEVAPSDAETIETTVEAPNVTSAGLLASDMGLAEKLTSVGATILDDLVFASGADALADEPFASLEQLAAFLIASPDTRITLVGHTDAIGALEGNVALSQRRAEAVRARLVDQYGVDRDRIDAQGVGFLSPRATNTTEDGRKTNRRVEVVLTAPLD